MDGLELVLGADRSAQVHVAEQLVIIVDQLQSVSLRVWPQAENSSAKARPIYQERLRQMMTPY